MRGTPNTFWGKLRQGKDGAAAEWHPLHDHCCDVAAVAEALLALPLWSRRIARLGGLGCSLDATTTARLCVLCALHDVGKFTIPFQAKGRPDLGPVTGGHVAEAVASISSDEICASLAPLGDFGDGARGLLLTAFAHHGRPLKEQGAAHQRTRWQRRGGLDPVAGVDTLVAACRVWFPRAFQSGPPLPECAALEHAFAGLVTLADWLGSNAAFFPFSTGPENRMPFARSHAAELVRKMDLGLPDEARADAWGRAPFARVSEYVPTAAQQTVASLPEAPSGSICVLESETGSGKTEAALARFVSLLERGAVDGLYFALPTRTAATQIFCRVRAAVKRAFANPPPVVLAVPGYIQVDDEHGRKLPDFDVLWPDADRFRYRGWAAESPKRYLAGTVVVGTVDQVLLSSLMVSHAHLRATSLLRHLLVVDEVHASDDYMTRILEDVLARHARAGGHALLLSATLGDEARERLLHPGESRPAARTLDTASDTPYPLVSFREVGAGPDARAIPVAHDGRRREIAIAHAPCLGDAPEVARLAVEAARGRAKVLVIRNTVADCVETQLAVEDAASPDSTLLFDCSGVAAPHHGRFSRDDRRALDDALERLIGKVRPEGGRVVVATQTVQQSLDLDADLLVTDLCPMDVLLQRIGRLHRHERPRPSGFEGPRVVVLVPAQRDLSPLVGKDGKPRNHHGLGSVYHDLRVLEATWRVVESEPVWRIPEMNRRLVERCLHSTALDAVVKASGLAFETHQKFLLGEWLGHRRLAELNLVDWSKPYSQTSFPDTVDERIKTRLGEGDRRVVFEPGFAGPFGCPVTELVIPAFWAHGAPDDASPDGATTAAGATRFRFGDQNFVYDRLGLRPDAEGGGGRARDDDAS